jgi:arylsulfatase A-like enzyme
MLARAGGCLAALVAWLAFTTAPRPAAAAPRPNVVIVLADDLGYGDPGVYNPASKIPTPNIDRLAAQGLRFLDAHTPSSVCTPTRYGLLTGRYAWRSSLKKGVLWGYSPALIEPGRPTIASLLRTAGYATAMIGKWHLGLGNAEKTDYDRPLEPGPNAAGFDEFFGIPASLDMDPYLFVKDTAPVEPPIAAIGPGEQRRKGGHGFWRAGRIAPSFKHEQVLPRLTEEAIAFLERQATRAPRVPFFLYFALTGPHTPWLPTREFQGKSQAGPYGDFAAQVDGVVGRVVEALGRLKLADDTLLFVTSDNGAHWLPSDIERWQHRANGALRGQKADIHEAGHRVPFVVRWPGKVPAGASTEQTICLTDLFATVAQVAGLKVPAEAAEDSFDFSRVLRNPRAARPVRDAVVHHSGDGLFAIRSGPWKLVLGLGSGGFTAPKHATPGPGEPEGQLYNLAADPGESRNLYAERPDVVRRLMALLERVRRQGKSRPGARARAAS